MMNKIISAALLITSALGQAMPGTTFMNTAGASGSGMTTGATMSIPSFAIDWLTTSANAAYPNAYPLDMCVPYNLATLTYVKYSCSATGSMLYKDVYSTSSCTGNYTSTTWQNGTTHPGLINSFYCSSSTDYYFGISASTCGSSSSPTIYVVPNLCFYNSDDNDTVTESYFWSCGLNGDSSVSLKTYSTSTLANCAGTASTTTSLSDSECKTVAGLGSLSLKISSKQCPSTTSSSASIITIGIMWLLASFFAIVLV